ncbi:GNAT family N-acetyltransferase [Demequina lutea]|uniref:Ribosomal protein S18 acetylase RimI-like enzyme n=1 Tax=Demequina lutea TaxID=431489 RepID=A0A7Y9ZAS8_9MICO|nr:GNAT family N-acetyltransferase [Demequina lutea]NYI41929.1 ribosomal protein S18 acetylase RimI-like enzyme [Demequina lutea]
MDTELIDAYIAAFVARCEVMWRPGCLMVNEPGLYGLQSTAEDPPTRLLVTDDRACAALAALLQDVRGGTVSVFAEATRCTGIVASSGGWKPKPVTAMMSRELRTLPEAPLPAGLALRPVRRRDEDPENGVPLDDAVAVATAANPLGEDTANPLADYLKSLPPTTRLFAAVDDDGVVRATSGSGRFGEQASVIFVSTDPSWRRRGIGQAMTAAALSFGRSAGARQACLGASDEAIGIYQRLGFEIVAQTTQFYRAGPG